MSSNADLRLSHKGFILVGVPLFIETVFLAVLSVLLWQSEGEAVRAEHSRNVVGKANRIIALVYDQQSILYAYCSTQNKLLGERYDELTIDLPNEMRELIWMVRNVPAQLRPVEKMAVAANDLIDMLDGVKELADQKDLQGLADLKNRIPELQQLETELVASLREFVKSEEKQHKNSPASEAQYRARIKILIGIGVILNGVVAFALADFFNKGTVQRLNRLVDNTLRLGKGEELNECLEGIDEIAALDKTFHEVARKLEDAARKERAAIKYSADVICSLNANSIFAAVSPAALSLWGYGPEELIGQPLETVIFPADWSQTRKQIDELVKSGGADGSFENRVSRKDGSISYLLWSACWSQSENLLFCVAHDISSRKEIERLKQEFVATVSHELRTPLHAVQTSLTILSEGKVNVGELTDLGKRKVEIAERNISRLIHLINDLLDIEKMESGKMNMLMQPVEVSYILSRSLDSVAALSDKRNISLSADSSELEIVADGDRLVQVLVNFLSNAIKYSPENSAVKIVLSEVSDWIRIGVCDKGRGIPDEMRESVFERFQQVTVADGKPGTGWGLGLAICKAIVEAHDGRIGVDSVVGEGSTFWFELPLKKQESNELIN